MKNLFLALLLTLSCVTWAESSEPPTPNLWEGTATATFLNTSGNADTSTLGLGAGAVFNPAPWKAIAKADYLESSAGGTQTAQILTALARGERGVTERLASFAQTDFLRNTFAGFNARLGAEAGMSYSFIQTEEHTLSAEAGLGFISEDRTDIGGNSFASARGSAEYKWKFSSTADFTTSIGLLGSLNDTADWRLTNVNAVSAALTSLLSLKVSFRVDYLTLPVAGKVATDTTTSVALVAKF